MDEKCAESLLGAVFKEAVPNLSIEEWGCLSFFKFVASSLQRLGNGVVDQWRVWLDEVVGLVVAVRGLDRLIFD